MKIGFDYLPYERAKLEREKRTEMIDRFLIMCGLCIVNIATFPSLFDVVANGGTPPPATFTGLLFCGLSFYLVYSLRKKLYFYALGEFIGICSNGFLFYSALGL